jgi:hypothetical protein
MLDRGPDGAQVGVTAPRCLEVGGGGPHGPLVEQEAIERRKLSPSAQEQEDERCASQPGNGTGTHPINVAPPQPGGRKGERTGGDGLAPD